MSLVNNAVDKYTIIQDPNGRYRTSIAKGIEVAIKMLPKEDFRRIQRKEQASLLVDISHPELGTIRIRDVRIIWSEKNQCFHVRWKQWRTGKIRDNRPEYLDVAGPLDPVSRKEFSSKILEVFFQVRKEINRHLQS